MVALNPVTYQKRFRELRKLHQPDYSDAIDPSRFAPHFPGIPDYGCIGCDEHLPWHTSFHIRDEQGRSVIVDAHDCFGAEPISSKGKAIGARTFTQLQALYDHSRSLP